MKYNQTTDLEVNGIKISADITVDIDQDEFPCIGEDFDFENDKENKKYLKRFETGELSSLIIRVTASSCGLEGYATLGGCHVNTNDEMNDVQDIIRDHKMIENALDELKTNILHQAKLLKQFS